MVTLNVELAAKRLQLLHELVPAANIIALLVNPTDSNVETTLQSLRAAARALRLQVHVLRASTEREIDDAFAVLSQLKAGGVVLALMYFSTRGANSSGRWRVGTGRPPFINTVRLPWPAVS